MCAGWENINIKFFYLLDKNIVISEKKSNLVTPRFSLTMFCFVVRVLCKIHYELLIVYLTFKRPGYSIEANPYVEPAINDGNPAATVPCDLFKSFQKHRCVRKTCKNGKKNCYIFFL